MTLERIASELQQLYRIDPMPPIRECLISAMHFQTYCHTHPQVDPDCRETLVLEQGPDGIDVGLYVAPAIRRQLAGDPPWQRLHAQNLDATCVAIEGVSHLVCLWWKSHRELPCSLLELELQAEIDKYLLCARWLQQQGNPDRTLLARLFHHYQLRGGMTQAAAHRYHRASRLAWCFCRSAAQRFPVLVDQARAFYRMTHWQKLRALPVVENSRLR